MTVHVSNDGSSLISGMFFGTANFGNSISLSSPTMDGFTAKMNADGTFASPGCKFLPGSGCGSFGLDHNRCTDGNTSLTTNPTSYNDVFVAKLDQTELPLGKANRRDSQRSAGIAVFGDGSSVVTGGFQVPLILEPPYSTNHLAKLDSNGNYLWASKAPGHDADDLTTVTIITGDFASTANFGNFSLNEFGGVSSFVAKLDAFLGPRKRVRTNVVSVNAGLGVEASTDGSSIIAGHFQGECNFGDNIDNFGFPTVRRQARFIRKLCLDCKGRRYKFPNFTHRRKFSDYRTVPRHCTIR